MGKNDKPKSPSTQPSAPFNTPFAALGGLRESLPAGEAKPDAKPAAQPPATATKAVVRYERKGRGGKEVTVLSHLELSKAELERWLKRLKQTLGVGGHIEESLIVLQGDQRERITEPLTSLGVKKITIG